MIVTCNLATPAIRKSSILEELSSVSAGLIAMVLFYCITWAFGPLAYIRFPDLAIPDFYPVFQVGLLNEVFISCPWLGLEFLAWGFCCGVTRLLFNTLSCGDSGVCEEQGMFHFVLIFFLSPSFFQQKTILEQTKKKHDDIASIATDRSDVTA